MSEEISLSVVMERFFALREDQAKVLARHKAELEPLAEEMLVITRYVADQLNQQGLSQIALKGVGTAFFQAKDSVRVTNWDEVLQHIRSTDSFYLLNHAISKTAVKEFIEVTGAPPPGVKYDSFREVQFRKGK